MKTIIIGGEITPEPCEYCGNIDELRPYGKNGAKICFDCGMKDENIKETENTFDNILSGKSEAPTKDQSN